MGTNYYAKRDDGSSDVEGLHIGKSSGGWEFLFRRHAGIAGSTVDWHNFLSQPDVHIHTDTGYIVPLADFWARATQRPQDVGGLHNLML